MSVSDLARRDVVTADPATVVNELAFTTANVRVGCVVIIEGEEPVGIVADRDVALEDLLVRLAGEISNLAGVVEAESPPCEDG